MVDDTTVNDRRPGDTCRLSRSAITLACIVSNWLAKSTTHVRNLIIFLWSTIFAHTFCAFIKRTGVVTKRLKVAYRYLATYRSLVITPALYLLQSFLLIVDLLFYVHGKHLWSCRDGQLT